MTQNGHVRLLLQCMIYMHIRKIILGQVGGNEPIELYSLKLETRF